jgi:hypothetical protein
VLVLNVGVFDSRLDDFPYVPTLPHVPDKVRFAGGLTKIASNKSKSAQANATGSGGMHRSSHWIASLIQLYFCIGHSGDILPNTIQYNLNIRGQVIELGNVTAKVFNLIYAILNLYFQCKKSSFTETEVLQLEEITQTVNTHLSLLWELKQAVLQAEKNKRMRLHKNHSLNHFASSIRLYGAPSKYNADRWEGAHPIFTTGVYQRVSKRKETMNKEMTKKGIALARLTHSNHVSGILVYGVNYIKRISPKVEPEYLEVSATHGVPIYLLHYNSKTSLFELDMTRAKASGKDKLINSVLAHQNLTPVIFTAMINRYCATENVEAIREYWWYNICKTGELKLSIVSGLTFEGNEESKIGRGHIYAISEFRHDNNRPRYDFVEIDIGSKTALAQVLTFFSLSDENASSYYAIVQYLVEEDGKNVN